MLALLALIGLALHWRLDALLVPDMDEGVYVYAGKLIAEGSSPYRDFMLAHPPLVPWIAALTWKLTGGGLEATRLAAIAITLATGIPVFLLARRIAGSRAAGFLAVCAYVSGLVWIANLGRTLRLEPVQNALLVSGTAAWFLGKGRRSAFAAGALLGGAVAAKLTSVVPIALLAGAEWRWSVGGGRGRTGRRAAALLSGSLVVAPLGAWCLAQPGFVEWAIVAQALRPRQGLGARTAAFGEAALRFPPLVPALLYAVWQAWSRDSRRRTLAVLGLGSTGAVVFLFGTFFRHYLALALPWLSVLVGVGAVGAVRGVARRVLVAMAVPLALLAPVAFTELSIRRAPEHSTGAATVIPFLVAGRGYLLTSFPDFALASGRPLVPWYFAVDSYLGRETGRLGDEAFAAAVSRASMVVLESGEADRLPVTRDVLAKRFRRLPTDPHWAAWEALETPR